MTGDFAYLKRKAAHLLSESESARQRVTVIGDRSYTDFLSACDPNVIAALIERLETLEEALKGAHVIAEHAGEVLRANKGTARLNGVAAEVAAEVERACGLFAPMHGPHEALAVIMEEFEEYKAEVFRFNLAKGRDTRPQQREELIELAAMAVRAVLETTGSGEARQ